MSASLYINFNGNSKEVFEYYSEVFGTEPPVFMYYGEAPQDEELKLTDETKKLVMHGSITIKKLKIMFSDIMPDEPFIIGNTYSIMIQSSDLNDLVYLYNTLKEKGEVIVPLHETFWSKCYGSVKDKYDTIWQLNYDEDV